MCNLSIRSISYQQWPAPSSQGTAQKNVFWFGASTDPKRELAKVAFARDGVNSSTRVKLCPQSSAEITIDSVKTTVIPALYMPEFDLQCNPGGKADGVRLELSQTNASCPTFDLPKEPRTYLLEPRRLTPPWQTLLSIGVTSNKVAQLIMVNKADYTHSEVLINMKGDVRMTTVYHKSGMYLEYTRLNSAHVQDKTALLSCTIVRSLNSTTPP